MDRSLTIASMIHVTKEFLTPNSECSNHALENQSVKSDIHISPVPRHEQNVQTNTSVSDLSFIFISFFYFDFRRFQCNFLMYIY